MTPANEPATESSTLLGVLGRPWLDLTLLIDPRPLDELHEEICLGLAQLPLDYTGGSHRSMGIVPSRRQDDVLRDYGEVIRQLSDAEFAVFRSLSDRPDLIAAGRGRDTTFGEERAVPLSRRQMMWLKIRFGVYFPWKGYLELMPNHRWDDKADPAGKRFTRVAESYFPKTIAFVRSLPFKHVGRCLVMGVEGNDWGTVHRDGHPEEQESPDEFISFCPAGDKRLFLYDEGLDREVPIESRIYWFNDFDYHGVAVSPVFRYSVRVDGVFQDEFRERLQSEAAR